MVSGVAPPKEAEAMQEEVQKLEGEVKKEWPALISGVGGITALIGLVASLAGGVTWLVNHHKQSQQQQAKLALAQTEAEQGQYQISIETYGEILKDDPTDRPALDGQLSAAKLWVENFLATLPADQDSLLPSAAMLDQIMPILEAGLTRTQGAQAADIQAHLAWAHWFNEDLAQRESGDAGEENLRQALKLDPANPLANAMMADSTLRTDGDLTKALSYFHNAEATGKARPLVRMFELTSLLRFDNKGSRAELVRVANAMRKGGEPLEGEYRSRVADMCFDPNLRYLDELMESLTAAPPGEVWLTYEWLDPNPDSDYRLRMHRFVEASLLEVSGDKTGALARFRELQKGLKDQPGSFKDQVDAAVTRLKG
jgi:tetratricopeptide (TPR) repeat protein